MAERLTPERRFLRDQIDSRGAKWAEDRMPTFIARLSAQTTDWGAHYHVDMADLLAGYRAQQVEIDRLLKANDYLRGQIFRGPGACYCVCHNPLSSCGYCQHCKGDNSVGEFHRLRALLGEARGDIVQASEHLQSFPHPANCDAIHEAFGVMRRLLAKLAQDADRG